MNSYSASGTLLELHLSMGKKSIRAFMILAVALAGIAARADDGASGAPTPPPLKYSMNFEDKGHSQYPSMFRISVLGGPTVGDMGGAADFGDTGETYMGAVLIDIGQGWFSVETGAEFLTFGTVITVDDPQGAVESQKYRANSQYVGIPLVAKYNYIEHSGASFSLKLGVMPATMISGTGIRVQASGPTGTSELDASLNRFDAMAVGGFTGSAPLNKWAAFVVDATYIYGMTDVDGNGTHNQAMFLGAGFRFNL